MRNAVLEKPEFLKIPYDNKKVVDDICKSGLLEMAREAEEKTEWPLIAEEYFEKAAKQLGIPDYRNLHSTFRRL